MKWDLYERNLLSERHVRYGGYGGIGYYHVSDTYVALFSHFIPCGVWEAVYILDGLLKNRSDIQPDTVHADTQGQSTPVFGLAYLLGIDLMPRIRNWKGMKLFRPSKTSRYKHIESQAQTRILRHLAEEGEEFDDATLSRLSPYLTEHVNRFRKYTLNLDRDSPTLDYTLELRPGMEPTLASASV
jgi:TnpA family transposase